MNRRIIPDQKRVMQRAVFFACLIAGSVILIYLQARWMKEKQQEYTDIPILEFANVIDNQTIRAFCRHCDGAGVVRTAGPSENDMAVCPVCFGLGMNQLRLLSRTDVVCDRCLGMGRVTSDQIDEAATCSRCGGRGLLHVETEDLAIHAQRAPCYHCDGRGILNDSKSSKGYVMCTVCFGRGGNLLRKLDTREDMCPACQGMGRVVDDVTGDGRDCKLCSGRGLSISKAEK